MHAPKQFCFVFIMRDVNFINFNADMTGKLLLPLTPGRFLVQFGAVSARTTRVGSFSALTGTSPSSPLFYIQSQNLRNNSKQNPEIEEFF